MSSPLPLSLCNELLAADGHDLAAQCRIAAELGYAGLEIAPGTLGAAPHALDDGAVSEIRRTVEAAGLVVTGLHWLLAPYPGLSITDPGRRDATLEVLTGLVRLCAGLGGRVLVHGSPGQRAPREGDAPPAAVEHATALFARLAPEVGRAGVTYCLEPLSDVETPVINRVEEAVRVVDAIGSPAFATMIDTSAAARTETVPVAELLERWLGGRARRPRAAQRQRARCARHRGRSVRGHRRGPAPRALATPAGRRAVPDAPRRRGHRRDRHRHDPRAREALGMTEPTTLRVLGVRIGERAVRLRLPFRFGDTVVREACEAHVAVRVEIDGARIAGQSAQLMVPRWFDKRAERSNEDTVEELRESLRVSARALPGERDTVAGLSRELREHVGARLVPAMPALAAGFGPATLEMALIDALCRGLGRSFPEAVRHDLSGLAAHAPPDVGAEAMRHTLEAIAPLDRIAVRHTVGYDAPLTGADVGERPDALPVALDEVIAATGIDRFKLKLKGDAVADIERLCAIAATLDPLERYLVTLDANEQYAGAEPFAEFLSRLGSTPALARLAAATAFVEQPFPREIALAEDGPRPPAGAALLIDESDDDEGAFRVALGRGWSGTSIKSCKGVLRALVNAARVRLAEAGGARAMLSGEDLTCQPGLCWQQDTLMAATLGVAHVERNGHHFAGGMQGAGEIERRAFAQAHPDIYRMHDGRPTLAIEDGRVRVGSLDAPGFAARVRPDMNDTHPLIEENVQ